MTCTRRWILVHTSLTPVHTCPHFIAPRAKQYLPFFQRAGKMQAVVEYVLSGHRLKLSIPKEGVTIVFAPSGIKTPSRAQPAAPGKPAIAAEPYGGWEHMVLGCCGRCMLKGGGCDHHVCSKWHQDPSQAQPTARGRPAIAAEPDGGWEHMVLGWCGRCVLKGGGCKHRLCTQRHQDPLPSAARCPWQARHRCRAICKVPGHEVQAHTCC